MNGEHPVPVTATSSWLTGPADCKGRRLQKLVVLSLIWTWLWLASDVDVRTRQLYVVVAVRRRYAHYANVLSSFSLRRQVRHTCSKLIYIIKFSATILHCTAVTDDRLAHGIRVAMKLFLCLLTHVTGGHAELSRQAKRRLSKNIISDHQHMIIIYHY